MQRQRLLCAWSELHHRTAPQDPCDRDPAVRARPSKYITKQAMDAAIKIVTASMELCVLIMPDMAPLVNMQLFSHLKAHLSKEEAAAMQDTPEAPIRTSFTAAQQKLAARFIR